MSSPPKQHSGQDQPTESNTSPQPQLALECPQRDAVLETHAGTRATTFRISGLPRGLRDDAINFLAVTPLFLKSKNLDVDTTKFVS